MKYETPIIISFSWNCPYHGLHQESVALSSKPTPNKIISQNFCKGYPSEPIVRTRLYGNLKLVVNEVVKGQ